MADGAERQVVVFHLGGEVYGINIGTVREIIRMQAITFVPDAPGFVRGVINLRGRVIPVVDLRTRFAFPVTPATPDSRILVVDSGGIDIGVIVDAVTEVRRIDDATIEPPSGLLTTDDTSYIEGITNADGRLLILLDLDRALASMRGIAIEIDPPATGAAA